MAATPSKTRIAKSSPRPYVVAGYVVIILMFGVIGGWAATAKIASAVIASGTVSLENNRQVVQHLEGGIVQKIHIQEADFVEAGDVLITLNPLQAASNLEVLSQRRLVALATEARLEAERSFEEEITFPQELLTSDEAPVAHAMMVQRNIFRDRQSILSSRRDVLQSRISQLRRQIEGLELQQDALERRQALRSDLITRLRDGEERGFVEANRLTDLEDGLIQIEAQLGEIISSVAQTEAAVGETELTLLQIRQEYAERASLELNEISDQLTELSERERVALDTLARTEIRAPSSGTIQNLRVSTVGSVIAPREVLMEVVPKDEDLIINAQVAPTDVDSLSPGMETEVRFAAFDAQLTPIVLGKVRTLSNDVMSSGDNAPPYFLARIVVDDADMPDNIREGLSAGMPVDVVIPTGERSVMYYLVSPLADAIATSMREE